MMIARWGSPVDVSRVVLPKRPVAYLWVHGLILSLKCKYVLGALSPGFAVCGIDMCKNMGNAVFELADRVGVCVEVASAVVFSVEVTVAFKGVVAMDRDLELDTIALGFDHEFIQTVQNCVII